MKKLILCLLLPTLSAHAQEMIQPDTGKQIVSVVKDIQVQDMLNKTQEFSKCRNDNQFKPGASTEEKNRMIAKAEGCFKDELAKNKDPKKLEELAETLNLQHYGLVQSKNIKDIQAYLSNKMYEAMTGVNRQEADQNKLVESMKFGKKKNIDQKTFITLYKTQLGKNALFEVSRFCFENFRKNGGNSSATSFTEYWQDYRPGTLSKINEVTDTGNPKFGPTLDDKDKKKVYENIFTSIQGSDKKGLTEEQLSKFFLECGQLIVPLCSEFEKTTKVGANDIKSEVDAKEVSRGSSACLAKSRIQEYRKALANIKLVEADFDKMRNSDKSLGLLMSGMKGEPIITFGQGQDPNEASIDDLTNNTSADVLQGGLNEDSSLDQKAKACEENPEIAKCDSFIAAGDQLDRAKHTVEMEMTLKRDIEMARVRELKGKDQKDIKKYLEDGGYMDILNAYNESKGEISIDKIEEMIGQAFEAKKIATLEAINAKLGKRQVAKDATLDAGKVQEVIKDSKEERARLAQVVLFNNIITGYLSLNKRDASGKTETVGRNVSAWKKEEAALNGKVDSSYFANLKESSDKAKGMDKDSQIGGFEVLDTLLGKKDDDKTK
jgi:hypothetical protein